MARISIWRTPEVRARYFAPALGVDGHPDDSTEESDSDISSEDAEVSTVVAHNEPDPPPTSSIPATPKKNSTDTGNSQNDASNDYRRRHQTTNRNAASSSRAPSHLSEKPNSSTPVKSYSDRSNNVTRQKQKSDGHYKAVRERRHVKYRNVFKLFETVSGTENLQELSTRVKKHMRTRQGGVQAKAWLEGFKGEKDASQKVEVFWLAAMTEEVNTAFYTVHFVQTRKGLNDIHSVLARLYRKCTRGATKSRASRLAAQMDSIST